MDTVEVAVLGLVGSVATQLLKGLAKKVGGPAALGLAFFAVLVLALLWSLLQHYAPKELVALVVASFTMAVAWYEVLLKRTGIW